MSLEHIDDLSHFQSGTNSASKTVRSIVLIFIFVCVGFGGFFSYRFFHSITQLRDALLDANDSFLRADFAAALDDLHDARDAQTSLEGQLHMIGFLDFIPGTQDIFLTSRKVSRASFVMIRSGLHVGQSAKKIFEPLKKSGVSNFQSASSEVRFLSLTALVQALPELAGARAEMELATADLRSLPRHIAFGPFASLQQSLLQKQYKLENLFSKSLPLFQIMPQLAGYPDKKKYLFLLQNNTEVRATGGFIGTYGVVTVQNGKIESFKTDNVYNLDDRAPAGFLVEAPAPFSTYSAKKDRKWFFRDSNWSPDFPASAQQAIWFYEHEKGGEKFDGVIAMTPDVLVSLLKVLGPVPVDDISFTSENFVSQLEYQTEKGFYQKGLAERARKDIIGTLASELLDRLSNLSSEKMKALYDELRIVLDEKQLLVYFTNPIFQQVAHTAPWAGEIQQKNGDFLMVVDSNLYSLKTDKVMEKNIHYTVQERNEGSLVARLELTYTHHGEYAWDTTKYMDYVRILIPEGSKILDTQGAMLSENSGDSGALEISHDHGKMVVGTFLVVEPKKTHSLMIEYQLPPQFFQNLQKGTYSFYMQKQSGVSSQQFEGNFSFLRPIKSYESQGVIQRDDPTRIRISTQLKKDQEITLKF